MLHIQVINPSAKVGKQNIMSFIIPQDLKDGKSTKLAVAGLDAAMDYIRKVGSGVMIKITCEED